MTNSLEQDNVILRANCYGLPLNKNHDIDTKLVSTVGSADIAHGYREKALDTNGLSAEHLYYCHPSFFMWLFCQNVLINVNMLLCTSCI